MSRTSSFEFFRLNPIFHGPNVAVSSPGGPLSEEVSEMFEGVLDKVEAGGSNLRVHNSVIVGQDRVPVKGLLGRTAQKTFSRLGHVAEFGGNGQKLKAIIFSQELQERIDTAKPGSALSQAEVRVLGV